MVIKDSIKMQGGQPITLGQQCKLQDLGINDASLSFANLGLESDRYVCVKDQDASGQPQVVVIDMHANNAVDRKTMKAEASIMNPVDNIIALRAKNEGADFIQVYNLDSKAKLGVYTAQEAIVFWTWTSNTQLAFVTSTSVYHWNVVSQPDSQPEKIFDRAEKLAAADTQIVGYSVEPAGAWCLLSGISKGASNTIDGHLQLYSIERRQQQLLEGHGGCFGKVQVGDKEPEATIFACAQRAKGQTATKLICTDIGKERSAAGFGAFKVTKDVATPPEDPDDFALGMHISNKFGVIFKITKKGYAYMFDAASAELLFRARVSKEAVIKTCKSAKNGGALYITRTGEVCSVTVNESTLVQYVMNLQHIENRRDIAFGLAGRFRLPGAGDLFRGQFQQAFQSGDLTAAAQAAAKAPELRSPDTINKFKNAPTQAGQKPPLLQYFSILLEYGKLNQLESVELTQLVLQQGREDLVKKWMEEDKLECSEQLGDVVKARSPDMAKSIYYKGGCHQKTIQCFMETGEFDKIQAYVKRVNFTADYSVLLRNMVIMNGEQACNFAKNLLDNNPPLIDINQIVDVFTSQSKLQETTSVLLHYLRENKPEHAKLQTDLLKWNLQQAPQQAEAIFQMDLFTYYDKPTIAQLCEKQGLWQRALQNYTDIQDVRRVLTYAPTMNPQFLVDYATKLAPNVCMEIMTDLMKNRHQNVQVVVQVAIKSWSAIGAMEIINMFEAAESNEGIFYFCGAILSQLPNETSDIPFKYIQAAARMGNMQEVERVCRESQNYDPVKVKDFLKGEKLPDPRPLIYVCDLNGFVEELTTYLYQNQLMKYIDVYVMKVNPLNTPKVVGALIDLDCSEDFIKNLLQSVRAACPVEPLVEEVNKRNRVRLLLPWLEARAQEGNQETALHNALGMIYIEMNREPENWLKTNPYYDSAVIGAFCEERDPHLAYTAYKRAFGTCDDQLVTCTNKNGLFRLQARYLVERMNEDLWNKVLDEENEHRRAVIDQVVVTALPEAKDPDQVSVTVKAFIKAELPNELIELLEKIVLHNSEFAAQPKLQNLLIVTAIRSDKDRVMDYINRLEHYDGLQIAKIALEEKHGLYEEAFTIYKKQDMKEEAMEVLLDKMGDLNRASEFAARIGDPAVWTKLGRSHLDAGSILEAIDCFMKAENSDFYVQVIQLAQEQEKYEELVKYLVMARNKVKDAHLDSELVYSYAKAGSVGEMEEFVTGSTTANLQMIADRLYNQQMYSEAKILYATIPNNSKLANCWLKLEEYNNAVEAAKKANNPTTWKEVNLACVAAKEFRCAQISGMQIIIHPDHLEELVMQYEKYGYYEELITLLDQGLGHERSHIGLFTELGSLYAKYKPEKLNDYIKLNSTKVNIPKLIRACERHSLWPEAVALYTDYNEFDSAANCMMQHSPTAWTHDKFLLVLQKISNTEIYYRAVAFYLEEHPMQVSALLSAVEAKVDHARVVQQLRSCGHLALGFEYLKNVQSCNIPQVNEALNELYIEKEDHEGLRDSVAGYDSFDSIALASRLENHELLEMRRIASLLYTQNKKYKQAIDLSKADKIYKDCMEAAKASGQAELAEELLKFFVTEGLSECFSACCYICYDIIKPDLVMELAWRHKMVDASMPFMIQTVAHLSARVAQLEKESAATKAEKEKEKSAVNDYQDTGFGGGQLAIGNAPHMGAPMGGMGMGAGGMGMGGGMGGGMGMGMGMGGNGMPPMGGGMGF